MSRLLGRRRKIKRDMSVYKVTPMRNAPPKATRRAKRLLVRESKPTGLMRVIHRILK